MNPGAWFTAFLLVVALVFLVESAELSPLGRLAPLCVLLPTAAMTLVQLVQDVRGPGGSEREPQAGRRRRQVRITLWIAGLAAAIYLVGFLAATTTFLLMYLRLETRASWRSSLLVSAVTVGAIYLAFTVLADLRFPEGVVF